MGAARLAVAGEPVFAQPEGPILMIKKVLNRISPFRGIRALFAAVMGALGILLGVALTGFMQWHLEVELRGAAQRSLSSVAVEIAHKLTEDLASREREIVLMADMMGAGSALRPEAVQQVMSGLKTRQPVYAWIGMADVNGVVRNASDGLLQGQNVGSRPWFAAGLKDRFIGDPHEAVLLAAHLASRTEGEPLRFLDVAAPMRDEAGELQGVPAAHLY